MGLEDGLEGRKRARDVQRTFWYWELKWSKIDILRRTASRFNSFYITQGSETHVLLNLNNRLKLLSLNFENN